ncbi:MAG: hypothetical protein IH936_14350 [Acidobacteria bacterium]|nr:hypothetical protein [Acidobacteriota bacterium]
MITGYNTDVRHRGMVFHVQTEDKGVNNPSIETLVYVGGQILHRRRSEYAKLLKEGGGKEEILELLEAQHHTLIDEIKTGKLDAETESRIGPLSGPIVSSEAESKPAVPDSGAQAGTELAASAEARESSLESLDQVILDYLTMEAEQEYLILAMDSLGELKLGSDVRLALQAKTSGSSDPVADAEITVKLISTVAQPLILATGQTNDEGNLNLRISIPLIKGTAALIISASSEAGTAEIKHLI